MDKIIKPVLIIGIIAAYIAMRLAAWKKTEGKGIDNDNPYILADPGKEKPSGGNLYVNYVKPFFDHVLSFIALVILSPLFAVLAVIIYVEDPGPVFFTQKRVGKDKKFFCIHKFRSMKMETPADVPTHQLSDPDRYITKVGHFLRSSSLDELPQLWEIFRGKMSLVGPRPALYNQADLVAERDKGGSNDVVPGLTGYAQINGRDELSIEDKAALDNEYAAAMRRGGFSAFLMDLKCLFGTVIPVFTGKGIKEGRS